MRVAQQMAAAMVGVDNAMTAEGVEDLLGYVRQLGKAEAKLELVFPFDEETVLPRSMAARAVIFEKFYVPARDRRRAIVDKYLAGEVKREDLPTDLITLLLVHGEEAGITEEIAFRECLLMLTAGTMTTALSTTWTVHELTHWLADHPEDHDKVADNSYLLTVFQEALRLHPGAGANLRRATDHVELGGDEVSSGDFVLLHKARANRDATVFGDDVDAFNPRREVPKGVSAYGLAFGHGAHKCYGLPMVIGNRNTDGVAVQLLSRLFAAGLKPDPDSPPTKFGQHFASGMFDQWLTYPVILGRR
jgi:cytochrome P450